MKAEIKAGIVFELYKSQAIAWLANVVRGF
jgi:hypothetical protein